MQHYESIVRLRKRQRRWEAAREQFKGVQDLYDLPLLAKHPLVDYLHVQNGVGSTTSGQGWSTSEFKSSAKLCRSYKRAASQLHGFLTVLLGIWHCDSSCAVRSMSP